MIIIIQSRWSHGCESLLGEDVRENGRRIGDSVANNFFQSVLLKRESKQKGNSWRVVRSKEFALFFTVKK